jgi:myosin heavy chain 9/10/11/14
MHSTDIRFSDVQAQRDTITRLREENRRIRSDYDELQLQYDDEVYKYNSSGAKKEKERLETKIVDLTRAFEASSAAQAEQQSQIVALHSQVRELRGALDEVEADRALLQKARRALQAELEGLNNVDTSKFSSDREYQMLHLEKQDLQRALEEQTDRVANALDRMKKAEFHANESQIELGKIRVENSELDRRNVSASLHFVAESRVRI